MSDNDLIRRGDALKVAEAEMRRYGFGLPDGRGDQMQIAIKAIPAVQPTVSPDVAELPPSIVVREAITTEGHIAIRNVDFDDAEMGLCLIPIAHIDGLIAALARVKGVM